MSPINPKKDNRPAKGAWAPGGYLFACKRCNAWCVGDKRAWECADCAYAEPPPAVAIKPLDWSNFGGPKLNTGWTPDIQELIHTALNHLDGEGDADQDAGEQIIERLLSALRSVLVGAAPPAVPDGWELVPLDPSAAIVMAGARAMLAPEGRTPSKADLWGMRAGYRAMLDAAPEPPVACSLPHLKWQEPNFAKSIEHIIDEESQGGAACGWKPCSGCYDTEDGHPTGDYPHSSMFNCDVGSGCSECGGLGVVWEHWTAEALDEMAKDCEPPATTHAITKEWVEKRAAQEGDLEVGAGKRMTMTINLTPDELAKIERLLPQRTANPLMEQMAGALQRADQFIRNGIELGYIRMPDASTPDSAHQTPNIVRAALATYKASKELRS